MNTSENKQENPEFLNDFKAEVHVESPGRINLIGEHTDYNHGFVMPTAINKKIYFQIKKNNSQTNCRIYSETFEDYFEFELDQFSKSTASWHNYILGVVDEILKTGRKLQGFDCIIKTELPIGAGISSSAALECGLAGGLNKLFALELSKEEIVALSQKAENNFVGSNCGIMDQYASVMSKENHLILLDCDSLNAEYIPADFKDCKLLLLNTNVSHNLADSEYNTRRKECENAVALIKEKYPEVDTLRDVSFDILEEFKENLPSKSYDRCSYVLEENSRVLEAAEAIKSGDLEYFGELMYQSHRGLQYKYEVSCPELDFLVDYSIDKDYIHGSRMMGGGFGGCTINIIQEKYLNEYIDEVSKSYIDKFNIKPDAIAVLPDEGTVVK